MTFFSTILSKVMNFTDPDPQKLLRINPLKITVKKLCVHHTYLNGQAAIYIPKSVFASRVDPGGEIYKRLSVNRWTHDKKVIFPLLYVA